LRRDRLSKEEQLAYDSHIEDLRVQRSVMQTGLFEGREEGRKEGIGEGIKIGRVEGIEIGIEKGLKLVAERALKNGMSPEAVMELTGLTKEEINSLSL
jgi:predicted transposase/invertase (TIGR01784 family)